MNWTNNAYHIMIGLKILLHLVYGLTSSLVTIIILDLAAILHAQQPEQTKDVNQALTSAQLQASTTGLFKKITRRFPISQSSGVFSKVFHKSTTTQSNFSDDQLIEFILQNRLDPSLVPQ
ncbi:hypothetical protein CPB83DRAFT_848862 [Crepidotus variabilis]|uniref:Uncharacterized protein n=1 Tax=Crepidotus variabilis TaxID=179855 RepID=A0A9P6JT92_9AGAR|nr:hypothetical protein CPB83DRAFT_848862 [Crepidotus variabilis]